MFYFRPFSKLSLWLLSFRKPGPGLSLVASRGRHFLQFRSTLSPSLGIIKPEMYTNFYGMMTVLVFSD